MRIEDQLPNIDSLGVVYVYCAPCACQIPTAVDLCRGKGILEFLDSAVHIDEHIPSSCRRMTTSLALLSSLRNYVSEIVANGQSHYRMDYIDWPWLEQRIYKLKQEAYEAPNTGSAGGRSCPKITLQP
jgi:hypothetical protein